MSTRVQTPANATRETSFTPAGSGAAREHRQCSESTRATPRSTEPVHDFGQVRVHHRAPAAIQTKLTVNEPGDKYEQEADRVADEVMRMPDPARPEDADFFERAPGSSIQRKCAECKEEELQRQSIKEDEEELQLKPIGSGNSVQRQTVPEEDEKDEVQAKELPGQTPVVTSQTQANINNQRGRGEPN